MTRSSPDRRLFVAPASPGQDDRARERTLLACGLLTLLVTLALAWVLGRGALALLDLGLLGRIWPLLSGTLLTTAIAVAVAAPLGLLAAIYLAEFATEQARRVVEPTLEVLAGIPTVVFGYFALVFLTPALARVIPGLAELNPLSPGIVMGVMIAPMVASLSAAALAGVPRSLREAAWALGASELSTILRVVLPAARSGVAAAIVLAVARALGETMIVTIAAGSQARAGWDPRAPIETMTTALVDLAGGGAATPERAFEGIYAIAAALLGLTLLTNLLAQRLVRRAREEAA